LLRAKAAKCTDLDMEDKLHTMQGENPAIDAVCIEIDVKESNWAFSIGPGPGPQMPKKKRHIYPSE
jgi:hypothetical protein